ncbi:MAG TPA: ferredoxin--NADP reductase [Candidatus Eisenbacteria bacterium]|nr:ferredoxin--NADP reductase [Candidatus Eisenbacteria bacterium]
MSFLTPRDLNAPDDRFFRAKITERVDFAADLWVLRVRAGGEFDFVPGQFASLGLEIDGKRIERPYSITSTPSDNEVEFFLELVPHGALTPHLHRLQVGDELLMRKVAKGKFSLNTSNGKINHLLVSTVTGVAPFISYVRTLCKEWKEGRFDGSQNLYLLSGASRPWELGYQDELAHLESELPWFKYIPTVSRPWDHAEWRGETGRIEDILRKYADHWELKPNDTAAYLCGHPEMVDNSKAILKRRGFVEKGVVKEEVYWIQHR